MAHIGGPQGNAPGQERVQAFRTAAKAARFDRAPVARVPYSEDGGARALETLLRRHPDITAVYASSFGQAIGALHAARGLGLDVPAQLSVAGYDDLPLAGFIAPPLTTVAMPLAALGAAAVDVLLEQVAGAPARDVVIPTDVVLVRRASTGPPPATASPLRQRGPRTTRTAARDVG